jgi:hypothetical protein
VFKLKIDVSLFIQTLLLFKFFVIKELAPKKQLFPILTMLPTVEFNPKKLFSPIVEFPPILAPDVIQL